MSRSRLWYPPPKKYGKIYGLPVVNAAGERIHVTFLIRHIAATILEQRAGKRCAIVYRDVWEVRAVEENRVAETIHSLEPKYFGTEQEAERYACIRLFDEDPVPQLETPKEIKIHATCSPSEMRLLSRAN